MRATPTAIIVLVFALAGCGGDDAPPVWDGRPELQEDGSIPVQEFASFQAEADLRWERSPLLVAGEFLRLDEASAFRVTATSVTGAEGGGPASVVVTLDGVQDDSVAAERYVLRLSPDGDVWRLESATWGQRCQRGRGHQTFTPEPCV